MQRECTATPTQTVLSFGGGDGDTGEEGSSIMEYMLLFAKLELNIVLSICMIVTVILLCCFIVKSLYVFIVLPVLSQTATKPDVAF